MSPDEAHASAGSPAGGPAVRTPQPAAPLGAGQDQWPGRPPTDRTRPDPVHTDRPGSPSSGRGASGSGLRGSLRRRPLLWFFLLAFSLSWVAWTPYVLSENGLGVWHFTFPGGSGGSQLTGVLPGAYLGPIASALLLTSLTEGRRGLRTWGRRMTRFRISWRWYVAVLLSVPAALTIAATALGDRGPSMPTLAVLTAYLPGLVLQLITTGLAEEPGWREFAMPRAQERYGPLPATLLVGVLWGAWHLPLFLTEWGGGPHVHPAKVGAFLATTLCFSFAMTWVFNRSGESMPLVMLMHTSVNNFFSVAWTGMFPRLTDDDTTYAFLLASMAGALLVLVLTRGRLGYRPAVADPLAAVDPFSAVDAPTGGGASSRRGGRLHRR
ncbi:CPBP family glutamic-type intramembrane protease [Streptomyces sp. DW26H14]|uniref:CPBP family glutamic-type intramembrane protease n=1 Tax=Streptomyces sp. DW26H14 TaxID=3435395 RepID=UPI00403D5A22